MNCPTCDHTMAALGYCDGGTVFHCERCGTVKHNNFLIDAPPRVHVPKLVERCREYKATASDRITGLWCRLGIAESINLPEDRPS